MTKFQIGLLVSAVVAVVILFFAGSTVPPEKRSGSVAKDSATISNFSIQDIENQVIAELSPQRQQFLKGIDAAVKRGDVQQQQIDAFKQRAHFYHDSINVPILHLHYLSEAALLEGNEKSLNFAGHSILEYLPFAQNFDAQKWLAQLGKSLFEKALVLNPDNDSTIVGEGACFMFGADDGSGPMAGIMKVRSVAERDSTNMYAQYMLGLGGLMSGQLDKAVERFEKVAAAQPENVEVLFRLAELNERLERKSDAIKWYQVIRERVDRPDLRTEIENRIKTLQTQAP